MRQGAIPPRSGDGQSKNACEMRTADPDEEDGRKAQAGKLERLHGAESEPATPKLSRAPRADACHPFVRKRIAEALPELCQALLGKAKQGDLSAMKLLWQMAELDKRTEPSGEHDRDRKFVRQALAKYRQC